ncbi:MAG: T9SS type A sorting domain-containing protein [Bacteroidetes bacterium]|nr:T9SS type A sorting domain-containing protein [Bacteroidota bacterium]
MKKELLILSFAFLGKTFDTKAQDSAYLDLNSIKAAFYSDGGLFSNGQVSHFEAPKGSGSSTMFVSQLWIGGLDAGGNLRTACQTYKQTGSDFWPGPLDPITDSIDAATSVQYDKVWRINKSTIDSFKLGLFTTIPQEIIDWPGKGGSSFSSDMTPFFDFNGNTIYDPANGDYPIIKGDQAVYFIFNDKLHAHTETSSAQIGLEIHGMAYAYKCYSDTALNNTIFLNYKIINKSSLTLHNTKVGLWSDLDIGGPFDDYIGCDSTLNMYYGYNGDNNDASSGGIVGYGTALGAEGIVFLNKQMSGFTYYNNDNTLAGNPTNASDYYNYMNAKWRDGLPITYGGNGRGGNAPTPYMFSGFPEVPAGWIETVTPGDRRGLGSVDIDTLLAGGIIDLDIAFVFSRAAAGQNNGASVGLLKQRAQQIQAFYNSGLLPTCNNLASVGNVNKPKISIGVFPNPATNKLSVKINSAIESIQIIDVLGNTVLSVQHTQSNEIDIQSLSAGVYFAKVKSTNNQESIVRFVKE